MMENKAIKRIFDWDKKISDEDPQAKDCSYCSLEYRGALVMTYYKAEEPLRRIMSLIEIRFEHCPKCGKKIGDK